jgi:hypothetical protein
LSAERIAGLNDDFRKTFSPTLGKIRMTSGVAVLPDNEREALFEAIMAFRDFTPDNDPYGEHDFIPVEYGGVKYYAMFAYYDLEMKNRSIDPDDPSKALRIFKIMRADEW